MYGIDFRSSRVAGRPSSTSAISARTRSATSGFCESRYHVHAIAAATVSWPPNMNVISSLRTCRSVIVAPVSGSTALSSVPSRSGGCSLSRRRETIILSMISCSVARSRTKRRLVGVGIRSGTEKIASTCL